MIITRTPYRISFVGGGSDLPAFYERSQGMVVAATIDKYVYVAAKPGFEDHTILRYSLNELVKALDDIKHPLVREALRLTGLGQERLHVHVMGDVPGGTGVGSSGAFLVGLLNALWSLKGQRLDPRELAAQACHIEIDILGEPVGRQDQYATALGGVRRLWFNDDHSVPTRPVDCTEETLRRLHEHLLLVFLGTTRRSHEILDEQKARLPETFPIQCRIRDLVPSFVEILERGDDLLPLGALIHENWCLKKQLSSGVTSPLIDAYYRRARSAGAIGGKVLGAGGAGFMLLFCPPDRKQHVRQALAELRFVPFRFATSGSEVIFGDLSFMGR